MIKMIKKSVLLFLTQSQFRFDNECYLNLPDNHKRVSQELELSSMKDQSMRPVSILISFSFYFITLTCTPNQSVYAITYLQGANLSGTKSCGTLRAGHPQHYFYMCKLSFMLIKHIKFLNQFLELQHTLITN